MEFAEAVARREDEVAQALVAEKQRRALLELEIEEHGREQRSRPAPPAAASLLVDPAPAPHAGLTPLNEGETV